LLWQRLLAAISGGVLRKRIQEGGIMRAKGKQSTYRTVPNMTPSFKVNDRKYFAYIKQEGMMKKIITVIMIMVACFTGCAVADPVCTQPPIELPFAVHQKGATVRPIWYL
jgi:hypothetical protein